MDIGFIFLLLLGCAGITFTLVQSTIMDKIGVRPLWEKNQFLKELFNCSFCTGFHVGWIIGLIFLPLSIFLIFSFASAIFSFILERLSILIDDQIHK